MISTEYRLIGARSLQIFRPILLARLQRRIGVDKEMEHFEEWRRRRKRLWRPGSRIPFITEVGSIAGVFFDRRSRKKRKPKSRPPGQNKV